MPDYVRDNQIMIKALAYAIQAIKGLPEQLRERELQERITSILDVNVSDHGERKRLLDDANRHLNGRGASLCREVKELIEDAEHPVIMMMFLFQAIQQYASVIAEGGTESFTTKGDTGIDPGHWVACAKHVLAVRELKAKESEQDENDEN